ncbi:SAM-dependent methyltransferase HcgC family protein [Methanothermococcus sp.]|uniref:SAM-dependent methyltransferase HcgC family protein n=1 Tax=Methanothermococcus sp. TaxID=2614238 RepID=UPI0025E5BFE1|nr:SAM-dependent methyltransferase HcgC family protein [Methanothermococcus sp.]
MKYGITETVKTIESKIKVKDIIYDIVEKKTNAIKYFLEGQEFKQAIVFGAYLCGNYMAHSLIRDSDEVILVDVYPHLKDIIINEKITFMDSNKFNLALRNGKLNPDLIVDITGIGGIEPEILSQFNPDVLIVENPKCTYDIDIFEIDNSMERLNTGKKRGLLNTFRSSKVSKTSGTMTLTIDTVLDSCNEIRELDGVLYTIPNLKYYEGILFQEKDAKKFISELNTPAITVSCLDDDITPEIDKILLKNMKRINSFVEKIK